MGIVQKIKTGFTGAYRTGRRYAGATVLGLGVAAGSAAIPVSLYMLLRDNHTVTEQSMPQTRWTDHQINDWAAWKRDFLDCPSKNVCFVADPSREKQIVSEGMAFGLMMSVQMDDQPTFNRLLNGMNQMLGRGLPAWRGYLQNGKFVASGDQGWASATDADQDIAFALIQAHQRVQNGSWSGGSANYGKKAQFFLNLLWDNGVQYDGRTAILKPSEDWGGSTGSTGVVYNVSYASPAMYEAFQSFDANPAHKWDRLLEDTLTLREAILKARTIKTGQKNAQGQDMVDSLNGIPDWMSVVWTEKGLELYVPPEGRSSQFGFDAVRTLWRISLDIKLLKDENARRRCLEQARLLLDAVRGKNIPDDIEIFDPISGGFIKGKNVVLAAYTVLAEAAGDARYSELAGKLIHQPGGFYISSTENNIQNLYYDRTITWLALQTAEGGFRRFFNGRFSEAESKEVQVLRSQHNRSYGLLLEYAPFVGPEARSELDFMKRVLWFDEAEYLPIASEGRELEMRLARAGEAMSLQKLEEAAYQYRIVLESTSDPGLSLKAFNGLTGALTKAHLLPDAKVALFRELKARIAGNPYIDLGLAGSLMETYRESALTEALTIASDLYQDCPQLEVRARAAIISAQADVIFGTKHLSRSSNVETEILEEKETLKNEVRQTWFMPAIERFKKLLEKEGLSAETRSLIHFQMAETYYASGRGLLRADDLLLAGSYYRIAQGPALEVSLRRLATLQLIDSQLLISELPFLQADLNVYTLNSHQKQLLRNDRNFIAAIRELDSALARVSPADRIFHLQLLTKKISINNLAVDDPSILATGLIDPILKMVPHYRLRGQLERIIFFLNSGQTLKASADIDSLVRLAEALDSTNILPYGVSNQLRNLIFVIREHQRHPESNHINEELGRTQLALASLGSRQFSRSEAISAMIYDFKQHPEERRAYEDLVDLIERTLEESYALDYYRTHLDSREAVQEAADDLREIKRLILAEEPNLEAAVSRLEDLIEESGEPAWDTRIYKELLGAYSSLAWSFYKTDFPSAEALLLEILDRPHAEADNLQVRKLIASLQDKENRGQINVLLGQSPAERNNILASLAEMYKAKDGMQEKAIEIYLEILEIDPLLSGSELNQAIDGAVSRNTENLTIANKLKETLGIL